MGGAGPGLRECAEEEARALALALPPPPQVRALALALPPPPQVAAAARPQRLRERREAKGLRRERKRWGGRIFAAVLHSPHETSSALDGW